MASIDELGGGSGIGEHAPQERASQDQLSGRDRGVDQRVPGEERTARGQRADGDIPGRTRLLPRQLRHPGRSRKSVEAAGDEELRRSGGDRRYRALSRAPDRRGAGSVRCGHTVARTADGHPDLSGVWQVLNTAAWDIQGHHAQKGVPAGIGVVEGDEIPYQPWAAAKQKQNYENRLTADPEGKCFLPGCRGSCTCRSPFRSCRRASA